MSFPDATDVLENLRPLDQNDEASTDGLYMDYSESSTRSNNFNPSYPNISNYSNANGNKNAKMVKNDKTSALNDSGNPSNQPPNSLDKTQLLTVVQFLKKYNFQNTQEILLKETANLLSEDDIKSLSSTTNLNESNFTAFNYKSEGNPNIYEDNYKQLQRFVDCSLDSYRHELSKLLYPVFVHMYLELVCSEHEAQAIHFMRKFGKQQDFCYSDDINKLSLVTRPEHFARYNEVVDNFRNTQELYTIRLSRDSHNYLKRFLQDKSQTSSGKATILVNIIQERVVIDVYEGLTRHKANVDAVSGAMFGEVARDVNNTRVFYGLLKEPDVKVDIDFDIDFDLNSTQQANDLSTGEAHASMLKKKKFKKDPSQSKKARSDPNAPSLTRIPLPELRDTEQKEKARARNEALKALKLSKDVLPSICLYTLLNAQPTSETTAICAEVSDDSTMLAAGFSDSVIRIWPLASKKIRQLKPASELENLDKDSDDVFLKMYEEKEAELKIFCGHSGPVYGLSFSPCRDLLLSCSEDSTIRLWSLLTWTNVVIYKGHCFPVWDVRFGPHGYYFASVSHDRTARLWATDNHNPLRVFVGHYSDVDCVQFHPNSNYIATGSTDRSVRLWDCSNGLCVRHMTGHKANVHVLAFDNSGRFLASAGADKRILIWDISSAHLVADLSGSHTSTILTLTFSRGPEAVILASGSLDNRVILWNMQKLFEDIDFEELTSTSTPSIKGKTESYVLASYPTKSTAILLNHFTRRNLLLSIGSFQQS